MVLVTCLMAMNVQNFMVLVLAKHHSSFIFSVKRTTVHHEEQGLFENIYPQKSKLICSDLKLFRFQPLSLMCICFYDWLCVKIIYDFQLNNNVQNTQNLINGVLILFIIKEDIWLAQMYRKTKQEYIFVLCRFVVLDVLHVYGDKISPIQCK